jgi:hypothetical protein
MHVLCSLAFVISKSVAQAGSHPYLFIYFFFFFKIKNHLFLHTELVLKKFKIYRKQGPNFL